MSWHPAVAWYAHHPWRVLPAEKFARIAAYAARHHVRMVVFETQVHGPPPGQSADVPFAVFRIDPMPLEALAAGQFDLRKVEQDALYALYVVVPTGGAEPAAGGLPAR